SLLCHAAGRSPQQQYCSRCRSVAAGVEDRETEPYHCNRCGWHHYRCQSRRCPPGRSGDTPGVRQDAHNALCALLCLVLRRLCDVSESCCHAPEVTWQALVSTLCKQEVSMQDISYSVARHSQPSFRYGKEAFPMAR